MCTYQTITVPMWGSGKGSQGWFPVSDASVYFDHPVHASAEHTLNIDLINPDRGAAARVAVELDAAAARALAEAILATLEAAPSGLTDETRDRSAGAGAGAGGAAAAGYRDGGT